MNRALETYSNIHRGSGHKSQVTTYLYEQARDIVLDYLGLDRDKYLIIFCSPCRAEAMISKLKQGSYRILSSHDIGLSLGVRAIAVRKNALPEGVPVHTGGGTTTIVSPDWVVWADVPDRFEAGTPAIINVIAFARSLQLIKHYGKDFFHEITFKNLTAKDILYHDETEGYSGQELLDELRKTMTGSDLVVPTLEGLRQFINLDNAASTPAFAPIRDVFLQTLCQFPGIHNEIIHEVRNICAEILDAPLDEYDVIFTSGTTESINLAAGNLIRQADPHIDPVIMNTFMEHNSNDLPWRMIPRSSMIRLKVDKDGFINLDEMITILQAYNQDFVYKNKRILLVTVSGASNVLGVFNDLSRIAEIVHRYGAYLFVDAAQMIAHRKTGMKQYGIDCMVFSAHKVYAPFGTGVLVIRKGIFDSNDPGMELIRLSGEENPAGIAALGKALLLLNRIGFDIIREEEQALTAKLLQGLMKIPGLTIYGIKDYASHEFANKGGVVVFNMEGIYSNVVAQELAERGGIGIRYGCHCAHILIKQLVGVGPVLEQLQKIMATVFHRIKFPGLARISLGIGNSEEDIDRLITVLNIIAKKQRYSKIKIKQQMNDFTRSVSGRVYSQL